MLMCGQTNRHTYRETDRQTDRQTDRHDEIQTDKQTDGWRVKLIEKRVDVIASTFYLSRNKLSITLYLLFF